MILKAENPVLNQGKTWLREAHASGVSTLYVQGGTAFDAQFIQFFEYGNELADILQFASYDVSAKTITLASATYTKHAYASNTPVYEQAYNKIRFYKASAVSATYSIEITSAITPDHVYTEFNFPTGADTDFGKFQAFDSVGSLTGTISNAFQLVPLVRTTAKDIIDGAKTLCGARNSSKWGMDDWRRALSDGLVRLTDELRMRDQWSSTTFSADGTEGKTLPSDFLEEAQVKLGNITYQVIPLEDYYRNNSNSLRCAIDGDNLLMGDTPTSNDSITLYYWALHAPVSGTAEEVTVGKRCILYLKYFIAEQYKLANQEDASDFAFRATEELNRLMDRNPKQLPDHFPGLHERTKKQVLDDPLNQF